MEITANTVQTVASGSNVLFTDTPIPGNCSIIHRDGSGIVKLRGMSSTQCRARFRVSFGGNIAQSTGAIQPISLAITVDGEPVSTTTMIVTPAATGDYFNVASDIFIDVPRCCCSTIGVTNTSTNSVTINVANANLIVERVA